MSRRDNTFDQGSKEQQIIEAAQKRFGLFGIEKTSMREIADDLKLSKASLYYYFPDKESLYKAVVETEQKEFLEKISLRVHNIDRPEMLLQEYSVARLSYFRTLLNLSRLRLEAYSDLKPVFRETILQFKEKEKDIIINIFMKGIEKGLFHIDQPDTTASLFLDLLKGLRVSVVNDKKTLFIDEDEYDSLMEKTVAFTKIFIKGLMTK
jgi:AcrR family transcriptional regulator